MLHYLTHWAWEQVGLFGKLVFNTDWLQYLSNNWSVRNYYFTHKPYAYHINLSHASQITLTCITLCLIVYTILSHIYYVFDYVACRTIRFAGPWERMHVQVFTVQIVIITRRTQMKLKLDKKNLPQFLMPLVLKLLVHVPGNDITSTRY